MKQLLLILLLVTTFACKQKEHSNNSNNTVAKAVATQALDLEKKKTSQNLPIKTPSNLSYSWRQSDETNNTLINRIPTPTGYKRISVEKGSFGDWLRFLPLKKEGSPVKLHNGSLKGNQSVHQAVVDIDVGKADLQQCADAVMRLQAEYHFSNKNFDKIHFNYTSGDKVSFKDWRKGKRPKVSGNTVRFVNTGKVSDSYSNFREYLNQIFTYAGTASLTKELTSKKMKDIQAGDVFIQGGFPGHSVLVLDVAVNEAGQKLFMVGQSYMPAQEFHVLKNKNNTEINPWYQSDFTDQLSTPEWSFQPTDLKEWGR